MGSVLVPLLVSSFYLRSSNVFSRPVHGGDNHYFEGYHVAKFNNKYYIKCNNTYFSSKEQQKGRKTRAVSTRHNWRSWAIGWQSPTIQSKTAKTYWWGHCIMIEITLYLHVVGNKRGGEERNDSAYETLGWCHSKASLPIGTSIMEYLPLLLLLNQQQNQACSCCQMQHPPLTGWYLFFAFVITYFSFSLMLVLNYAIETRKESQTVKGFCTPFLAANCC